MENPYEPSDTPWQLPPVHQSASPGYNFVSLIAFLPGAIAGLHLGAILEAGWAETWKRTTNDPGGALFFFCTFSIATLALSFIYRIPRRYIVGPHQITWWSAFGSGLLIVGLGISALVGLEWMKLYTNPPQLKDFVLVMFTIVCSYSIGIEFEALISHRLARIGKPRVS